MESDVSDLRAIARTSYAIGSWPNMNVIDTTIATRG